MAPRAERFDDPPAPPSERPARLALLGLTPERRELFDIRVARWLPDLRAGLRGIHPDEVADQLEARLLGAAATAYADRPADLHRLDQERTLAPD